MSDIPQVSLGELLTLKRRPVEVLPDVRYTEIGIYCFGRGIFHKTPRSGLEVGDKQLFLIKEGDFILQVTFAWEGAVALASSSEDGMYGSTRFLTFRVDEDRCFLPYLVNYFRTPSGVEQLVKISPGSAGRNRVLSLKRIPEVFVPLPQIEEQRRIVARVEELADKIGEARSLRRLALEEVKAFKASSKAQVLAGIHQLLQGQPVVLPSVRNNIRRGVTIPAQSNPIAAAWSVPENWIRVSIAELLLTGALIDVKDGNHGEVHPKANEFYSKGTPFVMASDVAEGYVEWTRTARLKEETVKRLRVGFAKSGDTLFTHKASIGRTAVTDCDCILSPQVTYYRCNPDIVDAHWLAHFLSSSLFLNQLDEIKGQSTRDYVSITKQYLLFVVLPPLPEQRRIVAYLDNLQAKVDQMKRLREDAIAELDALLPSILDKAFKGEL